MSLQLRPLVTDLAEQSLRDHGLFLRPIPYFEHVDRFDETLQRLAPECEPFLIALPEKTAARVVRTYAFSDELTRGVLRDVCPSLPRDGERAQRMLWGAAVLLDQILDEDEVDATALAPIREWVAGHKKSPEIYTSERPHTTGAASKVLVEMLEDFLVDCQRRSRNRFEYTGLHRSLLRVLDAELLSPGLDLRCPPDRCVRQSVYDKSVLLCWVGFYSCLLGSGDGQSATDSYRRFCDALGEILWIMDDLVDLEEDLDRGVWNRTLWILYDRVGGPRFRYAIRSKRRLAEMIRVERIVEQTISEIARRIEFANSLPNITDPTKLRTSLAFWVTSWIDVYM